MGTPVIAYPLFIASGTPRELGRQHGEQAGELIREFLARYPYQLKFVIDRPADLDEMRALLAELPDVDRGRVLLMPQGVTAEEVRARGLWLVEECKREGFRYCPRVHIDLYGNRRGV